MERSFQFKAGTSEGLEAAQVEMLLRDLLVGELDLMLHSPDGLQGLSINLQERDDPYTDRAATVTWRGQVDLFLDDSLRLPEQWNQQLCQRLGGNGGDIWWVRMQPLS
jgi:hypothetical protein